ncbi:MAG: hemerythrin domain-containing protein [Deferrisomatales bacterium]|nr:hemerythrin domain-containing protein [Deferrisomatales bacterium]
MRDVTAVMVDEHRLILRMITLVEHNAARLEAGEYRDWQFFLDAVAFIRNYADRFHHAKEEHVLFKELVRNGMPAENSPVAAMLLAHDQGRAFVKGMEIGALRGRSGAEDAAAQVVANSRGYAALLREHIHTEDHILYPLAERVLPADWRDGMAAAYASAEEDAPPGLQERYHTLVEGYEAELREAGTGA